MPIRKALPSDHKRMAEIAASAFIDDDVFGRFMHPQRRQFPEDYLSMWERSIWVNSHDYMREYLVSCDEETQEVVAWIVWMRHGQEGRMVRRKQGQRLTFLYTSLLDHLYTRVWPDRSCSPENVTAFHDAIPHAAHLWDPEKNRAECWQIESLCTHPEHEGKGHGSALVEWGLQKAGEEGVAACVIAAWERDGFYERFGFREVGRADVGPLEGQVKGGAVMFTDLKP